MSHPKRRQLVVNIALALAYGLIGHATLALGETGGVELRRVIWASSGIAVTVGLLAPFAIWPGVAAGGALATWLAGDALLMIVGTSAGNALEVALTVTFLRRLRFDVAMERVRDILALVFMGSGVAAAIGALVCVSALVLSGGIGQGAFVRVYLLWWLTHAMGMLVITPVGLTIARGRAGLLRRHPLETAGVLAAVGLTAWLPFGAAGDGIVSRLFFLPFPFLLWAAMRLGMSGAALASLIASSFAIVAAIRHSGPLAVGTPNQALILTWLYVNVVTLATLISTALVVSMERARAAHQSGEARLRAVFDGALEGIVVTDATGVVTHVNRAVGDIWPEHAPAPALAASFEPSLHALAAALPDESARALVVPAPGPDARGGSVTFDDGRTWEVNVDHLRGDEGHRGAVWSFRDVTGRIAAEQEHRQLQAQLLHGQKLESLGVLAGGIAHDFNNLLMAIRARAELIADAGGLPAEVREDIGAILRTSDQAAGLCRQMLTYAGRGAIEVQTVDLSAIAREMQDLVRVSVSRKVELQLELSAERLWVSADVTQLRQVVLNLVTNASDAVEATGRSGTVRVRTYPAALGSEWLSRAFIGQHVAPGEFRVLEISDDGVGMGEDVVRQIFDPFFSSKGPGRGLGLSSTLGVVRRHTGALGVESRPGAGSRFVVALPRASGPPREGHVVEEPLAGAEFVGRSILVVDDDEDVRRVVARMLARMGMHVLEASDGDAALSRLSGEGSSDIDIVLLDLTMPRKSGPATLAEMRAMGIEIPVIIASGYSSEALPEGVNVAGFVQKPFSWEALSRAIGKVLVTA